MPRVSVIIPTHDRQNVLLEAIDSVLAQTYRDYELLVVDDGSIDATKDIITKYGEKVHYIYQPHQGVSAARNLGIELTNGELTTFLDSDDLWMPNKLQTQVDFMNEHPDAQICYTDEIWIRRGVRVNPRKKHAKYSGDIYPYCLPLCIISPSSVLMRRELFDIVGTFDTDLPVCEDYDLWLRVASRMPIYFIPHKLIIKRGGHPDQLSQKEWGNDRYRVVAVLKILNEDVLTPQLRALTIRELQKKCKVLIAGYQKREKKEEARQYQDIVAQYPV